MYNLLDSVQISVVDYQFFISTKLHLSTTLNILLFRYSILTHALPRLLDLPDNILSSKISCPNHSSSNKKIGSIAPKPAACRFHYCDIEVEW